MKEDKDMDNGRYDSIMNDINLNKLLLSQTDYKALKYSEGLISEEDYAIIKLQRSEWRAKINELERELNTLQSNE